MSKRNRTLSSKWNFVLTVVVLVLISILLSPDAQAIGVTPGRTTLDFEPGLEKTITFTILNNEHKNFYAVIYVEGDLKDYVTLSNSLVKFTENMSSFSYTCTLKLPEELADPGDHWAKIVIMELSSPPGEKPEGSVVIATTAVVHQLRVRVPYPGKYAQAELSISEAQPREQVNFFVRVLNLGEQDFKARATIDILGPTNEKIATLQSNEKLIKSKNRGELLASWKADINPGIYHAVATVRYDDKVTRVERNFGVGNLLVEVRSVNVKDFRLGGIAKFNIDIESKWNEKINVYAQMVIKDSQGDTVADFKSASVDLEPLGQNTLYAYWDTEGVEKGTYDATVYLHYAGKVTEQRMTVDVGFNNIQTQIIGLTGGAVTGTGAPGIGPGLETYITALIVVLILINMSWFLYFKKRR